MVVPVAGCSNATTQPVWGSPFYRVESAHSWRTTMEDGEYYRTQGRKHRPFNTSKSDEGEACDTRKLTESGSPQQFGQHSTGMQSRGNQKEKLFGKPWRNRSKVIPNAGNSLWRPDPNEEFSWCSVGGRKVSLTPIEVGSLSEPERLALQQVALLKLRKHILRSHITIPKGSREKRTSSLKRALSLKSRLALGSSDKDKDSAVFAIPLRKAVAQAAQDTNGNGKKSKQDNGNGSNQTENQESAPDGFFKYRRHSASSLNNHFSRGLSESGGRGSSNGIREPPGSPSWKSRLIDALTLLSSSASASCIIDKQSTLAPGSPRVPPIVLQAIQHLESYGLHVLGIFRTGGSKKRMKQMREQFDSGEKKEFTAEDNPHDVAALFKEYFRDLPEPLLTRELYSAFLETQGFEEDAQQVKALRLLCCLLPAPNRDTLNILLEFLAKVDFYAEDREDDMGVEIPGNKMNSRNLATLIGPNILHKIKSKNDFAVDDLARSEEIKKVIDVVQDFIDHGKELFVISPEIHHDVFLHLLENEPEILDFLLRKKTPSRMSADEDDLYDFECRPRPKKETLTPSDSPIPRERVRTRSAGDSERLGFSGFTRAGSLNSRPPPEYPHKYRRWNGNTNNNNNNNNLTNISGATATWQRSVVNTPSPVPPIRSSSKHFNQDECSNVYKQRLYARQLSQPEDSLSSSYSRRQRTPPPPPRGLRRFASSNSSEPPSPALSSSFSHSSYSTPPSSPPSTPFYSADSSFSASPAVSYLGSEGPILTELTDLLTEVENDLARERERERLKSLGGAASDLGFDVTDWQMEKWVQWESITQKNSSKRDALEQETLV